jgi:hypothetical protein
MPPLDGETNNGSVVGHIIQYPRRRFNVIVLFTFSGRSVHDRMLY